MTPRETIVFNPDFSDPAYDIRKDFVFETGDKWANNEKQCYRDDASHCFVKDGILNIVATKEEGACRYISSRITTKETHLFNKGTFVVRAKMPKGRGAWPAVWFFPWGTGWPAIRNGSGRASGPPWWFPWPWVPDWCSSACCSGCFLSAVSVPAGWPVRV